MNTSLHEGFPNTFIQAWMREVAVVSLHVDPDGVLSREGVGVHAGTEQRLAEAVRGLVTDVATRAQIVARAYKHAMHRHSMQNVQLLTQLIDTGAIRSSLDTERREAFE